MPLAQDFKQKFSASTRHKGERYYRDARVTIVQSDGVGLEARVRGSQRTPYEVSLDWEDSADDVLVTCSCPHFEGGSYCKHLWATLLAADQQGVKLPSEVALKLVQSHDDFYEYEEEDAYDDLYDVDDDYDVDVFSANGSRVTSRSSSKVTKAGSQKQQLSKLTSWDRHLGRWQQAGENPLLSGKARPRRVLFLLDVAASLRSGALVFNLFQQDQHKNGNWGKAKVLKASRGMLTEFSPADQRRLGLVLGNYKGSSWSTGSRVPLHAHYEQPTSQVEVVPDLHDWLLPELCAEGNLHWILSADAPPADARPLVWDAGPAWEFRLVVEDNSKQKHWSLRGELVREGQVLRLADAVLLLSSGVVVFPDSLARFATPRDWRWVSLLRASDQVDVPYADRVKLLTELWAGDAPQWTDLPSSLQAQSSTAPPRGCLRIHAPKKQRFRYRTSPPDLLYADVGFDYAGRDVALRDTPNAFFDQASESVVVRDRDAEAALLEELSECQVVPARRIYGEDPAGNVQFRQDRFHSTVSTLTEKGWQVWAEGQVVKRAGAFQASVQSGVDWFDLEAHIDFDGSSATLPQLLVALQNNEQFVTLDDGSRGILPQQWLERFARLAEFAEVDGDHIRFRPSQALLLDALLEERSDEVAVKVDRQFDRFRAKLRSFAGVKPRQAPRGFQGKLRPYQEDGLGWMSFLEEFGLNGCLADDMGLGKTVQVLAWLVARLRRRQGKPTLIIAPKSVVTNWQLEAERFAPRLKVLNFTGLGRAELAEQIREAHVVLTTYGTLRQDIELLKEINFDYVILDEAQAIKNEKSISAKSCRLLQAEHRLALTGTPVENHLGDLWSIFEFLNPGMLGRLSALKPYTNGDSDGKSLETLRRGMAPFILRRTKEQVLKDLPAKSEQTLDVELLPADRKRYNELRDHYRNSLIERATKSGMNAVRMHVLEALLRLRQVACHSGLVDEKLADKPSAKLEVLLENIAEIVDEGHKALVFSQFTSLLTIVKSALDARGLQYEYLDGRTRNRQERIDRFQNDPSRSLFLISLKAGGTGLNLTAADYVFLLDPWWNPAVEKQAIDRVHRIGQQRPVFAYRLVANNTVEEKIIELQCKKRELADAIISGDKSVMTGLTLDDLQLLLS